MLIMLHLYKRFLKLCYFQNQKHLFKISQAAHLHSQRVFNLFLVTKSILEASVIINIVICDMFFLLLLGVWLECHLWPLISILGQLNQNIVQFLSKLHFRKKNLPKNQQQQKLLSFSHMMITKLEGHSSEEQMPQSNNMIPCTLNRTSSMR